MVQPYVSKIIQPETKKFQGSNLFRFNRLHFKGRKSPGVLTPKKSGGRAPTYTAWRDHPWNAPTHTRQRHLPGIDGKIAYLDVSN